MGEDLKVIVYIVVAIGWVIYNNYKKITRDAAKRNPQRPVSETPNENWPPFPFEEPKPAERMPEPIPVPAKRQPARKQFLHKLPKSEVTSGFLSSDIPGTEGGSVKPSGVVQFSKVPEHEPEQEHPWLAEFRSGTDWRKMIIGAEILQRPYS
jgi:hypothetical protein